MDEYIAGDYDSVVWFFNMAEHIPETSITNWEGATALLWTCKQRMCQCKCDNYPIRTDPSAGCRVITIRSDDNYKAREREFQQLNSNSVADLHQCIKPSDGRRHQHHLAGRPETIKLIIHCELLLLVVPSLHWNCIISSVPTFVQATVPHHTR